MDQYFQLIFDLVLTHWCFVAATGLFYACGQMFKKVAPVPSTSKTWAFVWRLLPFYPVLAGMLFGMIPGVPVPEEVKAIGNLVAFLYYSGAGVLATYGHDIYQTWRKYKHIPEE